MLQRHRLDMVERDGLMRVFWPADITTSEHPGVIVGWRNSGLDVVVVAVLEHVDVSLKQPMSTRSSAERFPNHFLRRRETSTMRSRLVSSYEVRRTQLHEYSSHVASHHFTCLA